MAKIAKKEERVVGAWRITILYDEQGNVIGAILESSRTVNPIYIARGEEVKAKIPQTVKRILRRYGFKV